METPDWGSFTLVSYVPGPLGHFLNDLRKSLPGTDFPQPHITILPPRTLRAPLEVATQQATTVLEGFTAFEVELSSVSRFTETEVIYLTISRGNSRLRELHAALNLSSLHATERFEFLPHITLGGPIPDSEMNSAEAGAMSAWADSDLHRSFLIREIVALWSPGPCDGRADWEQIWCYRLPMAQPAAVTSATRRS